MPGKEPSEFTGHLSPLGQFNRNVERAAREAAGEPPYGQDDPERPFTAEYDKPGVETTADKPSEVVGNPDETPNDDSPSSDARALFAVPTVKELQRERNSRHLKAARANLREIKSRDLGDIDPPVTKPTPPRLALGGLRREQAKRRHPSGGSVE